MSAVTLMALTAGLLLFWLITRRLRVLTRAVRRLISNGFEAMHPTTVTSPSAGTVRDEIELPHQAFGQMAARIAGQWPELLRQDQQRREMVADISHDLRTPLTSLHGYLETLALKAGQLD